MNQKGFTAALVVIGVAIILVISGGIAYFAMQKSNPVPENPPVDSSLSKIPDNTVQPLDSNQASGSGEIVNWSTYDNNEMGYSINYPSDWVINAWPVEPESIPAGVHSINFGRHQLAPSFGMDELEKVGFLIEIWIDTDKTLDEVLEENDIYKEREGYKKEMIDLKGISAYKIMNTGGDFRRNRIVFQKDNKVFSISVNYLGSPSSKDQEANTVFEKMVESIKFRDSLQ